MNPIKKVKLGLSRLTIPKLIQLGRRMVTFMTGNPNFTTLPVWFAQISAQVNAVEAAYNAAKATNSIQDYDAMRAAVKVLKPTLRAIGDYIDMVAKGNIEIIHSAGVEANKDRESAPVPDAVSKLVALLSGVAHTVNLKWGKTANARFFEVYMTTNPGDVNSWVLIGTKQTGRKFVAGNLVTGKRYWFKVVPYGTAGRGPDSIVVCQFAS